MPAFEVFIPTADPDGFNVTARIRADSWIQALRNGLTKLGDTADVRNILCDITEDGIHVTEPKSGRVFRIRELAEEVAAKASVAAPAPAPAPEPVTLVQPARAPAPAPAQASPPPPAARAAPPPAVAARPAAAASMPAPLIAGAAQARFQAQVQDEVVTREKASPTTTQKIGRAPSVVAKNIDDLMAELFEQSQALFDKPNLQAAASHILDLAIRNVPSDSGAVFISDINKSDLYFAAARGPKAQEVMKFRVPMGQGIVGFSAQEGVALAVSDVHRDPRFYAAISQALGYETRSILCAPAQKDGRVYGAIELINRKDGSSFTAQEVDIVNYLAYTFADYLEATGQGGD